MIYSIVVNKLVRLILNKRLGMVLELVSMSLLAMICLSMLVMDMLLGMVEHMDHRMGLVVVVLGKVVVLVVVDNRIFLSLESYRH